MSAGALSNKQFNTEQTLLHQGNDDEMMTRVRGIQNMTSNVYKPSFAEDYTTPHSAPASAGHTGSAEMEEEDQE